MTDARAPLEDALAVIRGALAEHDADCEDGPDCGDKAAVQLSLKPQWARALSEALGPASGWVSPSEVADAVAAEREACAREGDESLAEWDEWAAVQGWTEEQTEAAMLAVKLVVERIRARGASTATPSKQLDRDGDYPPALFHALAALPQPPDPSSEPDLDSPPFSLDAMKASASANVTHGSVSAPVGWAPDGTGVASANGGTPASPRGSDRTGGSIGAPAPEGCGCSMNRAEAEFLKDWASGRSLFGGNWARLTEVLRRAIELNAMDRSKVYEVRLLVGAAPEGDEDEDSGCPRCCGDGADLLTGRQACDLCSGTGRAAPEQKEGKA